MMGTALDMSLDDIIKSKKSAGRGRGRGGSAPRGSGGGGGGRGQGSGGRSLGRQVALGVDIRHSSSVIAKTSHRPMNLPWQHNLLKESLVAAGLPEMESGTKLYISNLDSGVSNNDIRELFSEIGELKRYAIHFDNSGRPSGSAEVIYAKRSDAFAAHKRYNNVQLDGRPMKIEVVIPNTEVPASARLNIVGGATGKTTKAVMMQSGGRPLASVPTIRRFGQGTRGGRAQNYGRAVAMGHGGASLLRGQGQRRGSGRGHGKKQEKSAKGQ